MRLLLDEMWSPSVARRLRDLGHDVIAVAERPDLRTKPDAAILETALTEDRVIVTQDVGDFRTLAAEELNAGRRYPTLVLTDKRRWPRGNARTTGRLVNALDALLTSGVEVDGEHWLTPPD